MRAPIVLFTYNRVEHTKKTVESLLKNSEVFQHDLIIFSDAAKVESDLVRVAEVRSYLQTIIGFKSITINHRTNNFGLANSIVSGVTSVLDSYEEIIVLEDDIVTSHYFLKYMNEALNKYKQEERVGCIHGYVYPVKNTLPEAFCLRGADCWGWATWRRGWKLFNGDGLYLLRELKSRKLIYEFNFNNAYNYSGMLQAQINGDNDSWAIRWHASLFLENKVTIYPGRSLVKNIGNDKSGTNCKLEETFNVVLSNAPIDITDLDLNPSESAFNAFRLFFKESNKISFEIYLKRIFDFIKIKSKNTKKVMKNWVPPILITQFCKLKARSRIKFVGKFSVWSLSLKNCTGYDSNNILSKVLESTIAVFNGVGALERDSVVLNHIEYSWPVTSALMWSAAQNNGELNVLDYGGSLGTSYFQNRKFLESLQCVNWSIVEQTHFVKAGKEHVENKRINFYESVDECVKAHNPKVALLSSVLQYVEDPFALLLKIAHYKFPIIIIDRTPFLTNSEPSYIRVQHVSSKIYSASYPCWFFSANELLAPLDKYGYQVIESFPSLDNLSPDAKWRGLIFKFSK